MIQIDQVVVVDANAPMYSPNRMVTKFVPVVDGCALDVAPFADPDAALLFGLQMKYQGIRSPFAALACSLLGIRWGS